MTAEQLVSLLCLVADMRSQLAAALEQIAAQAAEIAELRSRLEPTP